MSEDNQLVLAWSEDDKSIHVKRFDGTAWQPVGSSPNPERGEVRELELALDAAGVPVLAWDDRESAVHVARWEGSSWSRLGGPISANPEMFTPGRSPAIVARPGLVVLAWSEPPIGSFIPAVHVWQHRDGAWTALGQPLRAGTESTWEAALALNAGLEPVVAWSELDSSGEKGMIAVSQLTFRGEWTTPEIVQGPTDFSGLGALSVTVEQGGAPWVAWSRAGETAREDIVYRRRSPNNGWGPEQLVGGGRLAGFEVDQAGFPWVAAVAFEYPGVVLTRPQ
jgi:hypothetical protein